MISLDHVSKIYGSGPSEVRALDDVSLQIAAGDFVALVGKSGSGKSTLLSLVAGLALPTAGKVAVAGEEVSALSPSLRAELRASRIGFVFQLFHLLPYLTVLENVLLGANHVGNGTEAHARELLNRFGLSERLAHVPAQLSAGERQRTALARALVHRPPLLLADEPTGNLDPASGQAVLDHIAEFHRAGGTVLLVTHDPAAAGRARRILTLERGRLVGVPASAVMDP
jgi:putative ABC transport system ATP-binding protein